MDLWSPRQIVSSYSDGIWLFLVYVCWIVPVIAWIRERQLRRALLKVYRTGKVIHGPYSQDDAPVLTGDELDRLDGKWKIGGVEVSKEEGIAAFKQRLKEAPGSAKECEQ